MNAKQEKDIIRVLAQAGKDDLAKTFARSRGYRVHAQDEMDTIKQLQKDVATLEKHAKAGKRQMMAVSCAAIAADVAYLLANLGGISSDNAHKIVQQFSNAVNKVK